MRKILFISIVLLLASKSFSAENAIDKGSYIMGLSGYLVHQSGELYEVNKKSRISINVTPAFYYFFKPGIYIGPEIVFEGQTYDDYDISKFGLGPRIGFILNPKAAEENKDQYSLFYFSIFTTISRLQVTETIYPYYYDYYSPYSYKQESTNLSFGFQFGTYSMVKSHFALDFNLRAFVDKNNIKNSSYDRTGYTILLGLGVVGFSY